MLTPELIQAAKPEATNALKSRAGTFTARERLDNGVLVLLRLEEDENGSFVETGFLPVSEGSPENGHHRRVGNGALGR